jgi:hypothetical protein
MKLKRPHFVGVRMGIRTLAPRRSATSRPLGSMAWESVGGRLGVGWGSV